MKHDHYQRLKPVKGREVVALIFTERMDDFWRLMGSPKGGKVDWWAKYFNRQRTTVFSWRSGAVSIPDWVILHLNALEALYEAGGPRAVRNLPRLQCDNPATALHRYAAETKRGVA